MSTRILECLLDNGMPHKVLGCPWSEGDLLGNVEPRGDIGVPVGVLGCPLGLVGGRGRLCYWDASVAWGSTLNVNRLLV